MQPRIGITSGLTGPHWRPEGETWRAYASAIERAGGDPVYLDPRTRGHERDTLATLQGLVLPGGNDVDLGMYPNPPDLHGEDAGAVMDRYRMHPEPERDAYELPLLEEALHRDLPLLGICRGCQVLAVGLGGQLILDIPLQTGTAVVHRAPSSAIHGACHALEVRPGTQLAAILDPATFRTCNSRHHQGVRQDTTPRAKVSALCPDDGLVEAIEVPDRRWAIGVQWHPEHPTDPGIRELYAPLFHAFVTAAS